MDGRRALAAGALLLLVVLSGCSAAGHLEMRPATSDAAIADGASRSAAAHDGLGDRPAVVVDAIENGSSTSEGEDPAVEPGLPFEHAGTYYDVNWTVVDSEPATEVRIEVDYNGTAPAEATVAYANLSDRDREALDATFPPRGTHRTKGPDFGTGAVYDGVERNRSVLLGGEYEAVRYEGETYPVNAWVADTVSIRTYRYEASVVADDAAAYAAALREEHLFTLSGLSESERSVVDAARNDTYYAEDTDDEAFRSVMERFREHEAIEREEYGGTWLVRYDGTVYLAELGYDGFDME